MDWLNVTEAARTSGLAERTIRKACEDGRLSARRKSGGWLIHFDDLKRWHETPNIHKPGPKPSKATKGSQTGRIQYD